MPWLDYFWKRNPLLPQWTKKNPLVAFGVARIVERQAKAEKRAIDVNKRDFLSRFIEAKAKGRNLPDEYGSALTGFEQILCAY